LTENHLDNILVTDITGNGMEISGSGKSYGNINLNNIVAVNNGENGIDIQADNISVIDSIVANNGQHGISVKGFDNALNGITANANQGHGVLLDSARSSTFTNITSTANSGYGLSITDVDSSLPSQYNDLSFLTLANNVGGGLNDLATTTTNRFTAMVDAYNSGTDCVDSGCTGLSTGLDTIFVGAIAEDTNYGYTSTTYPTYGQLKFETRLANPYRSWNNTLDPGDTLATGDCSESASTQCRIVDWSLQATDNFLLNKNSIPANTKKFYKLFALEAEGDTPPTNATEIDDDALGNNNGICEYREACVLELTYLENSYEQMGDGIGNDNNLCESGETCIYAPNLGSYQGHGTLEAATGAPDGYTLLQYNTNGY
jgi:hypothetical protein